MPTSRQGALILCAAACLLVSCGSSPGAGNPDAAAAPVHIGEASGVLVMDHDLLIVDDSSYNSYYRLHIPDDAGPVIALNDFNPVAVEIPVHTFIDLESIDRLADGRIVVLSERMRGLVGAEGPVVEYDYPLAEIGRRGLEGLAVRRLEDGSSRVAVVWEGGYPDPGSYHPEFEARIGNMPFSPLVFVHDIAPGARPGRVRWKEGHYHTLLAVPEPEGDVPAAQRFRAPDIEWYRWPGKTGEEAWGFMVLLGSQSAVNPPQFLHHIVQRFDMSGQPVGEPLDIAAFAPEEIGHANWEGLSWWEPGRSIILVHEGRGEIEAHALIVDLPEEWQY